jgi:hypothetical protein
MPMSSAGLSAAIKATLTARGWFNGNATSQAEMQAFCDDLANAIVPYIQTNATVLPTLLVAPGGGGPVTGTGTVT